MIEVETQKDTYISVFIYQSPVAFDLLSFTCVDNVRLQKLRWSKIKLKIEKRSIVPKLKYHFYFYEKNMPRMTAFSERIKDEYRVDGRF